jgi:NADPH-dependent curcumin reductase CurA
MPTASREWQLIARPVGEPAPTDFRLLKASVDDPGPGQVLIRNDWFSVDPYMRARMDDVPSYIPPFQLREPMTGGAVGTVVVSEAPGVPVGTTVLHFNGWREYALADAGAVQAVDPALAPPQAYLGVLGTTGLTAYAGLTEVAPLKAGEVVFISAAAGAVGSVAGQIARHLGAAKVIGSAGGPEKCRRVVEDFGFDAAIDYREGDLRDQLKRVAPEGVDVYFDNVGGGHLEAAISVMNRFGRICMCGAISAYNAAEPVPGPRNLALSIGKRLTLRGMIVGDHRNLMPHYLPTAAGWLRDGTLRSEETVVEGIEHGLDAFQGLMRGANTGKMLVKL